MTQLRAVVAHWSRIEHHDLRCQQLHLHSQMSVDRLPEPGTLVNRTCSGHMRPRTNAEDVSPHRDPFILVQFLYDTPAFEAREARHTMVQ